MSRAYLVRYGLMHHVGRFSAEPGASHGRGEPVVVRSRRGTELGEVLAELAGTDASAPPLRVAGPRDFERARLAQCDRPRRLAACEGIFRDGRWPLELVDVEPLLDDARTVLHYLGPHRMDASGLLQALRDRCGLDVVLEPVGRDVPDDVEEDGDPDDHGCGSCSSGGGGCGTGCGSEAGGCGGCAVKDLVKDRRMAPSR